MWLLESLTLQHQYFVSPEAVTEGYVILSHVWDEKEDSFQDLQAIHARCAASGERPHDLVSEKIKMCCEVAACEGYKWVWIDTCCIDKTSSAELSEAINSMFRYYALSLVCYAYLRDVPTKYAFRKPYSVAQLGLPSFGPPITESKFARSRWHQRGWTLQELVAPQIVHFLSASWEYLGSRSDIAETLEEVTSIPASVLRLEQRPADMSVAQRMSWAARRETTRMEDQAYCLLGIFDVNMPTLYGEGRKAFRRLQEEIMKQTHDTTVFAWGDPTELWTVLNSGEQENLDLPGSSLFANSPRDFAHAANVVYSPLAGPPDRHPVDKAERGDGLITFNTISYGIRARLPMIDIKGFAFGVLSWNTSAETGPTPLLLALGRRVQSRSSQTSTLPVHRVCTSRIVTVVSDYDTRIFQASRPVWKDILLEEPTPSPSIRPTLYVPINHGFSVPIRLPEHRIASLLPDHRARDIDIRTTTSPTSNIIPSMTVVAFSYCIPDNKDPPTWRRLALQFGGCNDSKASSTLNKDARLGCLWANITNRDLPDPSREGPTFHRCPEDHILSWPELRKEFPIDKYVEWGDEPELDLICEMTFEVTRHPLDPTRTDGRFPRLTLTDANFVAVVEGDSEKDDSESGDDDVWQDAESHGLGEEQLQVVDE
ncbi:heterokaryon incompatibility protein-domain-containing protein [Earliella scabrosa]|nr:heterokaryon incompatibility protein-domain-containing protein [Earliella scabrosa]